MSKSYSANMSNYSMIPQVKLDSNKAKKKGGGQRKEIENLHAPITPTPELECTDAVNKSGTAMLVSRNNTHKNDQALRSSQHSFHLEKRALFSKGSDSAASPSIRDIQTL